MNRPAPWTPSSAVSTSFADLGAHMCWVQRALFPWTDLSSQLLCCGFVKVMPTQPPPHSSRTENCLPQLFQASTSGGTFLGKRFSSEMDKTSEMRQ